MLARTPFRIGLALLGLLALALPAPAAPVPSGGVQVEKYLPDDADFVLIVNVKEALATPAYTKHYQKQVETLLKMAPVQEALKGTGVDPLRDIERVIVAVGPSSHRADPTGPGGGPFVILEGRFDPMKLRARADQAVKDHPGIFKPQTIGDARVYEIATPGLQIWVAPLSENAVGVAPAKELLGDMLAKAAGTKKTSLKNATMQKLLAKLDPKDVISGAAASELIVGTAVSTTVDGTGKRETKVTHHRLGDVGIASIVGGLTVGEDVKGKVTITAKNEEAGRTLAGQIKNGLDQAIKEGTREAARNKEILPLVEALKGVQVTPTGTTITLQGQGGPGVLESFVKMLFWGVAVERAAPVATPVPPKKP
jgi:hypothetical protein